MSSLQVPADASAQAGVFTRSQAYAGGWTPRQVKRRLAVGSWRRVAGIAISPAAQEIERWQLAYAVHLTWPAAVISHGLAGALWGFPIGVPTSGTATVEPGTKVTGHRLTALRRALPPGHVTRLGPLRVTTRSRTATDLLAELPWADARNLFAWLSTRGLLGRAELERWTAGRTGLAGTPQLRRLLAVSAGGSLSAAEDRFHAVLRGAGITGWQANARVVVNGRVIAVADVLFPAARVVVEVDGWSTHSGRAAFQRDRSTQNALVSAGYLVLRFTWADLTTRPDHVVRTVRRALISVARDPEKGSLATGLG